MENYRNQYEDELCFSSMYHTRNKQPGFIKIPEVVFNKLLDDIEEKRKVSMHSESVINFKLENREFVFLGH